MSAIKASPEIRGLLDLPAVLPVMQVMNGDGEETRLVGGVVRNYLIGCDIADIDMATTALPQAVTERAIAAGWKVVPTGIEHGTVTVVVDHVPVEITTLREDIETDGRHAVVRFGRDFAADAGRRDFTMNALSVDLDGRLHDYYGGVPDIAQRRVRFIGDSRQRIREDYLRILRFFRFHAVYGAGEPDGEGLAASITERLGLERISPERIRVELLKLLGGKAAITVMQAMDEGGILSQVLAGVGVFERLRRLPEGFTPLEGLAACAVMVREDADRLRERLRLSNTEHRFLYEYASILEKLKGSGRTFEIDDIRRLCADWSPSAVLCVFQATMDEPSPKVSAAALQVLKRFVSGAEPVPVFPLRGADIVRQGVQKGPKIGRLMEKARALWMEMGCPEGKDVTEKLLSLVLETTDSTREG